MNDNGNDQDINIRLAKLEQMVTMGFESMNEKLAKIASRDDLSMAIQKSDAKFDKQLIDVKNHLAEHDKQITQLEDKVNKPLAGTALIATIITAIVTFLLTYFLEHLSR